MRIVEFNNLVNYLSIWASFFVYLDPFILLIYIKFRALLFYWGLWWQTGFLDDIQGFSLIRWRNQEYLTKNPSTYERDIEEDIKGIQFSVGKIDNNWLVFILDIEVGDCRFSSWADNVKLSLLSEALSQTPAVNLWVDQDNTNRILN